MAIYIGQKLINSTSSDYIKSGDNISKLTNDAGYITEDALEGYATSEEVADNYASKNELDGKISTGSLGTINGQSIENGNDITIDLSLYNIVESLPAVGDANANKIYLVLNAEGVAENTYIEYVVANGAWEKIGEYKANVNLDGYLTTAVANTTYVKNDDLDTKVSGLNYAKKSDLPTVPTTVSSFTNDAHYVTSSDVTITDLVYLSEAAYAALGTKSNTTLYIVG